MQESQALDEDDDDDIGPMPVSAQDDHLQKKKKIRGKWIKNGMLMIVLEHEKTFLNTIPESDMYERSLMHRDTVNFVQVTK